MPFIYRSVIYTYKLHNIHLKTMLLLFLRRGRRKDLAETLYTSMTLYVKLPFKIFSEKIFIRKEQNSNGLLKKRGNHEWKTKS